MTDLSIRGKLPHGVLTRAVPGASMELRSTPDGTGGETLTFTGYASVTESPYQMEDWLGPYTEVVRHGAFAQTLAAAPDVPFKVNHTGITLARTKSGTMRLAEDGTGLHVEADLDPSSPDVQSLRSAMQRGDVDEMSFGFRITGAEWSPDWTQLDITEVDINKGDVSAVNYGANPHTAGASLRSREALAGLIPADLFRLLVEQPSAPGESASASQDSDAARSVPSPYALAKGRLSFPGESAWISGH